MRKNCYILEFTYYLVPKNDSFYIVKIPAGYLEKNRGSGNPSKSGTPPVGSPNVWVKCEKDKDRT